jgi:integrase
VEIPCTKPSRRCWTALDRKAAVVLATKTDRPWKPRYFKAQWEASTKKAGITELHFHDLRGTAVTMLAEAGCPPPQIASIHRALAQDSDSDLDKYLSRTRVLAARP